MKTILITLFLLNPAAKFDRDKIIQNLEDASGVKIRISRVVRAGDITPHTFDAYAKYVRSFNLNTLSLVVAHSKRGVRGRVESGVSWQCRPDDGLSIVYLDRHSDTATHNFLIEHELGHALGASHDATQIHGRRSIMFPYFNAGVVRRAAGFFTKSIFEMRMCLGSTLLREDPL